MTNSINFGAKPVGMLPVLKYNKTLKSYLPENISLVEMELGAKQDLSAVCSAARNWRGNDYATEIAGDQCMLYEQYLNRQSYNIYAATTQKEKYDSLDAGKILGLAEISKFSPSIKLEYIQVKPEQAFRSKNRTYHGIGKSLIDFIKQTFNKKIVLQADYKAANFYEKLGFEMIDTNKFWYMWTPKK